MNRRMNWYPRQIKVFEGVNRGATMIAAGSMFSFAVNQCGTH